MNSAGRHRRHSSIHPERDAGNTAGLPTYISYSKENVFAESLAVACEKINEMGFLTRTQGKHTNS